MKRTLAIGALQLCTAASILGQMAGMATPDPALADAARAGGISVLALPPISAAVVARLAWRKIQSGETVTPERLEANYIRRTDAEMLERIGS